MKELRHLPYLPIHTRGLEMTAIDTTARTTRTASDHEQHDRPTSPLSAATRSACDRRLGVFFHHLLHRPLCAYLQLAGAILALLLHGCDATFTITTARQTCPRRAQRAGTKELTSHLVAGRFARSTRPS